MKRFYRAVMPIVLLFVGMYGEVEATWTVEYCGGTVYNFRTPLTIRQSGFDDITLHARYETRPFELPPYYSLRLARWKENRAWEFEFIHHKLYLRNKPPAVQIFSITHGYNILMANRAWEYRDFIFHLGAGCVVTHPETTVRDRRYSEKRGLFHKGYYISGPIIQAAAGKRFSFGRKIFVTIEGKLTGAYTRIPVEDGAADVTNVTVQGLLGVGYHL